MNETPNAREPFIGVWKLISCQRRWPNGGIDYPYGQDPIGRITYDRAGRMSAQLMRTGRPSTLAPGVSFTGGNADGEELRAAVEGFISYFGTFDVEESTHTVIHHVHACLVPSWVGTDLKRTYQFNGNRLVLTAVAAGISELTWEREPD